MKSLRRGLLTWLLPPLVLVGAAAAGGAYFFMERQLTAAYDQDLGDIARALVPYIHRTPEGFSLDVSRQADAILRADSHDKIFYAVIDPVGRLIAGDPVLPTPPPEALNAPMLFWDDARERQPIRAVALLDTIEGVPIRVVAAETLHKREAAARDALFSAIVPVALLSVAAVVSVLFGVRRGLGPVAQLREELQARSHVDLSPIGEKHVVEELKPLVDELNEMLGRLAAAQETQTRFIANAAHQLRTPIAGLVTQLDLARGETPNRDVHLAQGREAATRLARLAQQILSLAAADPISNPTMRHDRCDLADIVKAQADAWLRAATPRGVDIEFDLTPTPIVGSAVLVGELASNLVDNASRYGGANVRIATRGEGRSAILEVADDGPGIPAAERSRVFERFHRLQSGSTEGSGLGLAIVHEIAQRHHAAIEVTEPAEGRGTLVRVSFAAAT